MAAMETQIVPVKQDPGYQLLNFIGSGSFGVVHRALIGGHEFAVKIVNSKPSDVEKFNVECEIMKSLTHNNIVQCLRLPITYFDKPVLVMELMDRNLHQYLEASPVPYCTQVDITENILQAITYLHSNGIIHRDLSSGNVLMKGNVAKVTDFGMVKLFRDVNSYNLTKCPGTAVYMPPEAFFDYPQYNETIDIFSVGVLMIQIQTRKFPQPIDRIQLVNNANDPQPSVIQMLSEVQRRVAHINECENDNPLKEIALCCLRDDKKDRPSALALCSRLTELQCSQRYLSDKHLVEHNMQLALQCKISLVPQLQLIDQHRQEIAQAEEKILILQAQNTQLTQLSEKQIQELQYQVSHLQQAKEIGEREITTLRSEVAVLKEANEDSKQCIQGLQSQVDQLITNSQQMQENFQKHQQMLSQQVSDFVQTIQSNSDKEKQQLQAEKEQISQQARQNVSALEEKITELEHSLSELCSLDLQIQDSRSDSQLSNHDKFIQFVASNDALRPMHRWSSAVVHGDAIFVTPARTRLILKYHNNEWAEISKCQAENSTLIFVDGDLVTIGGHLYSDNEITYIPTLFSLQDATKTWVDDALPPMHKPRDSVTAITSGKALVVAGGRAKELVSTTGVHGKVASGQPLTTVEIFSMENKTWQFVSELPLPFYYATPTICGDSLYILGGRGGVSDHKCVLTCKVADLILSRDYAQKSIWSEVKSLPVSRATCVTLQNHLLLAMGGMGDDHQPSDIVYCFDEESNSWNVFSHLLTPQEACFTAVLSNKLYVIGGKKGSTLLNSVEVGTFSF